MVEDRWFFAEATKVPENSHTSRFKKNQPKRNRRGKPKRPDRAYDQIEQEESRSSANRISSIHNSS
jgi:hypothetical protein